MRRCMGGRYFDRPAKLVGCLGELALLRQGHAEKAADVDVLRLAAQHLGIPRCRVVQSAALVHDHGFLEQNRRILRHRCHQTGNRRGAVERK